MEDWHSCLLLHVYVKLYLRNITVLIYLLKYLDYLP